MRRLASVAIPLAVLLIPAVPTTTIAQEHSTEIQQLDWFVGSWTYDHLEGGAECERLGEYIVQCRSVWKTDAGEDREGYFFTRYDTVAEAWKAYRFYNTGYADEGLGWVEGDTWTWVYEGRMGARYKFIGVEAGEKWTYTWYRSLQGGPWEQTSEGSMTKVP
jgi:hypothetical protein